MVKNLPAKAGGLGLIPGPGRSHMPWSNQACAPEPGNHIYCSPHVLEPVLCNKRSHSNEKPTHCNKVAGFPGLRQLEKNPHRDEDPAQPKINKYIKLFKKKDDDDVVTIKRMDAADSYLGPKMNKT